jgi:hypothetical protein
VFAHQGSQFTFVVDLALSLTNLRNYTYLPQFDIVVIIQLNQSPCIFR